MRHPESLLVPDASTEDRRVRLLPSEKRIVAELETSLEGPTSDPRKPPTSSEARSTLPPTDDGALLASVPDIASPTRSPAFAVTCSLRDILGCGEQPAMSDGTSRTQQSGRSLNDLAPLTNAPSLRRTC